MTSDPKTIYSTRTQVRHEPALARYSLWLDGENVGLADYVATGRHIRFTHTEVDPEQRGRGLAGILIERALDNVRLRSDLPVVADCSFTAHWIDTHAEYHDLLTRGR